MSIQVKQGRVCLNTQKRRLLAEVERLCSVLDRPVCSKDLAQVFRTEPHRQPILLQALGQLLLKAARPLPAPARYLRRVGILGNVAFYAPDEDPSWWARLKLHFVKLRVNRAMKEQFPRRASILFGTPFEEIARNSLAGFLLEWESTLGEADICDRVSLHGLETLLAQAKIAASRQFLAHAPADFVGREHAANLLRHEYGKRNKGVSAERQNVNRHLSRLKWPQSQLFKGIEVGRFSRLQIRSYVAEHWPRNVLLSDRFGSLCLCLRYGIGCAVLRSVDFEEM